MPEERIEGELTVEAGEASKETVAGSEVPKVLEKIELHEAPAEKQEGKYNELLSKVSNNTGGATTSDDDIAADAKSIGSVDEESKVQMLLDLANTKGVVHAVKVARSLKDYYALDKMHDELADKLYAGLVQKGLIDQE